MSLTIPITEAEVKGIAPGLGDICVGPFIDTANAFFENCFPSMEGISQAMGREVVKYLSAHFAVVASGQVEMEKIGDATTKFKVESGTGLLATIFGQQAINLDPTGKLGALDKKNSSYTGDFEVFCV